MGYEEDNGLIYISGVSPRSGTNFLYKCVYHHPLCFPSIDGEDYFLKKAEHLVSFASSVYSGWNTKWPIHKHNSPEGLISSLGKGLVHFLESQDVEFGSGEESRTIPVTKTPHVKNVDLFPTLFPDGFLLILVRDGRAVTESTMRTWGTPFDAAVKKWRKGARNAIDFIDSHGLSSEWHHVVRYEDLARDTEATLREVFASIGIDPELYPYEGVNDMPVLNSSTYGRDNDGEVWEEKEQGEDFDPLRRFSAWTKEQHQRFNWLAGTELRELGYRPEHGGTTGFDIAKQLLQDGKRMLGNVKRSVSNSV